MKTMTDLQKMSETGPFGRELFSLSVYRLKDFPELLALPSPHFVLFLACDARGVLGETIVTLANSLIKQGLTYFCTWGPDCKRVHDLFDQATLEYETQATDYSAIKTTWHEYESLDDALWFFLNNTFPAERYLSSCQSAVAVAVGKEDWSAKIEAVLANPLILSKAASRIHKDAESS